MNCSYCGKELKDRWNFCMHCGTRVEAMEEPEEKTIFTEETVFDLPEEKTMFSEERVFDLPEEKTMFSEETVYDEPVAAAPVMESTMRVAHGFDVPDFDLPRAEKTEVLPGRKITIDPEKFEFHPEVRDEPLPKAVSSWELVPAETMAPRLVLPTKRGLGKMIFLGMLTLGIYPTVIYSKIITELNIVASRYDGKRTVTFFGMMMLSPLTLGIYAYVWYHNLCARIGEELQRRGIDYKFGPSHFWLWGILGSFILVGPFIFVHKLMKSMNLLNKDFNEKG